MERNPKTEYQNTSDSFKSRDTGNPTAGEHPPHLHTLCYSAPYNSTWNLAGAQTALKPINTRVLSGLPRPCTGKRSTDVGCTKVNFIVGEVRREAQGAGAGPELCR